MKNIDHIQHIHSNEVTENGVKLPNSNQLLDGEIAVNNNYGNEVIAIKNSKSGITTFSSDNVLVPRISRTEHGLDDLNYVVSMLTSNNTSGARGYGEESPTLQMMEGDKEKLWSVLRHFKMGWFDGEGRLVRECRGGCISVDVDGNDIPIDGSLKDASGNTCDLMVYVDTDLYVDRCTVSGLNVEDSSATTHNVIGLGLKPHKVGEREAKKFEPFGFTPQRVIEIGGKYYSYFNNNRDSGRGEDFYEANLKSLAKGNGYMGLYYEFYEIWFIAMYLEMGTLDFTAQDRLGLGWGNYTPSSTLPWFDESKVGCSGGLTSGGTYVGHWGSTTLDWRNECFSAQLLAHAMMDGVVKANLTDKIGNTHLFEFSGGPSSYVVTDAPSDVDVTNYAKVPTGRTFFTVYTPSGCQGLKDGVMTAVVNVYSNERNMILKRQYSVYRGVTFNDSVYRQLVGINYVVRQTAATRGSFAPKQEFFYAADWRKVPTATTMYDSSNCFVSGATDADVSGVTLPMVATYQRSGEFDSRGDGWATTTDYDKSLFAHGVIGGRQSTYECGHIWWRGTSWNAPNDSTNSNGCLTVVAKSLNASRCGCHAGNVAAGRSLYAVYSASYGAADSAGGFAHPYIKLK